MLSIFICALVIAHKFQSSKARHKRQSYFQGLISGFLDSVGDEQDFYINLINKQLEKHPIDCVHGGVRLLENLTPQEKQKYMRVATYLRREDAILSCFNSYKKENKCMAIEAIGLGRVASLRHLVTSVLNHEIYAPFAVDALCRLDGLGAFDVVSVMHQKQMISTSQALASLSRLGKDDLNFVFNNNPSHPLKKYFISPSGGEVDA